MTERVLQTGKIPFSIEGRILRELGERLVKQPEVALLELIKNSYDADATNCAVSTGFNGSLIVRDDGIGMTLDQFATGWMRIGTSSKKDHPFSSRFHRPITGEKGIGRFAVRCLGRRLSLETVAEDSRLNARTRLKADFDWEEFDRHEDLGEISVEYSLTEVDHDIRLGTMLHISRPQSSVARIDWKQVATGAIGVVSADRALIPKNLTGYARGDHEDPGFALDIEGLADSEADLAKSILDHFALRAVMELKDDRLKLEIFRGQDRDPYLQVRDRYPSETGPIFADLRFFPRRSGTFRDAPVDGRRAYTWVRANSGVIVFDRGFQVRPYGTGGDDWLMLVADAARNWRHPRSTISEKHFPMTKEAQAAPAENWMLRLPEYAQLVGAVHVQGARSTNRDPAGLIAAADREGFIDNDAFRQLFDLVRGAVEAIAFGDRQIQLDEARIKAEVALEQSRAETRAAIQEINADPNLSPSQRHRIVAMLQSSQEQIEHQAESAKEREQQLEIMSLLGVIGGFMTHEFGVAISELRQAQRELDHVAQEIPRFGEFASKFRQHAEALEAFVAYSRAYVQGARGKPSKPYAARPRITQVIKVFGRYALDRDIETEVGVEPDVMVPLIPAALYNGVAQNLYTNALKAVTARADGDRKIAIRAWNDRHFHRLQVSDTGIGVPAPVRERIFDPLFTTTDSRRDPLGSGMGLGLALVKRGAEAFGGKAEMVDPPAGFATCMEVRFPLKEAE
jgi:signal transduction histidine kinase